MSRRSPLGGLRSIVVGNVDAARALQPWRRSRWQDARLALADLPSRRAWKFDLLSAVFGTAGSVLAASSVGDSSLFLQVLAGVGGLLAGVLLLGVSALVVFAMTAPSRHLAAVAQRLGTVERELEAFQEQAPQLSFGRAEIPRHSQAIHVLDPSGDRMRIANGRVIRVPVTNAQGAGEARDVHARLRFGEGRMSDDMFFPEPTQAQWMGESGPEFEIDLPGNGRPRLLDVVLILDQPYPHAFEWTPQSYAAGLHGYVIKAGRFPVTIEVMTSGPAPTAAHLVDTLDIECRDNHLLIADWQTRSTDEGTNHVGWTYRGPPRVMAG